MIYSFLTSSTQFIVELKQCSIVDKNQVLIPDAGTDHKGLPSCRQAKEVSFLPFCNCLTNKSLSTFANIWFDVKIAVVLLIMLTFNPLFQSRKWKQVETESAKVLQQIWSCIRIESEEYPNSFLFRQTKGNSFWIPFISGYLMQVFRKFS